MKLIDRKNADQLFALSTLWAESPAQESRSWGQSSEQQIRNKAQAGSKCRESLTRSKEWKKSLVEEQAADFFTYHTSAHISLPTHALLDRNADFF